MHIDPDGREYATVDLDLDADPTEDTVELRIDDTWYQMAWTGPAVETVVGSRWARSAQLLLAGPNAQNNPANTIVLELGRHPTAWRLVDDPELVVRESDWIDIS